MIVLSALLQDDGCIIVAFVTYREIQNWKTTLDLLSVAQNKSNFARIIIPRMKEQKNILLSGLCLSAVILGL